MNKFVAFLAVLVSTVCVARADLIAAPVSAVDATLAPNDRDMAAFAEQVKDHVAKYGADSLDCLTAFKLIGQEPFQKELFAWLKREAPRELQAALKSSGNLHNPKLEPLRKPFDRAVMATSAVQRINTVLAPHNLKVAGAAYEKFMLPKEEGRERRFWCIFYLRVGPAKAVR